MTTRIGAFGQPAPQPEFESGSWLIRCGSGAQQEELIRELPKELVVRQLRRFSIQRLMVCNPLASFEHGDGGAEAGPVLVSRDAAQEEVDAAWDGNWFETKTLAERLRLVATVDRQLRVGGLWFTVVKDHSGQHPAWGLPISAEEVVGYFSPAYHVLHQEQLTLGAGTSQALVFSTLVFAKARDIEAAQLDLDAQCSIQRVAARRRSQMRTLKFA